MDQGRYQRLFIDESRRHLDAAQRLLQVASSAHDADERWPDVLLRHVHTVKGMAAALDVQDVVRLAHELESAVALLPRALPRPSEETTQHLTQSLSALDALIAHVARSARWELSDGAQHTSEALVPLSELTAEYHALVAQAGHTLGKQVRLSLSGQALRVPTRWMSTLHAPLVQLLRNAVDHGIETPQVRTSRGKAAMGQLTLHAQRSATHVRIGVADDGAGLDVHAILERAVAQGVLAASEAAGLDAPAIFALLSEPGFSLASHLTTWSGRGMGLDIVKADLKRLGGVLEVTSTLGEGSEFCCVLPSPNAL